MKLEQRSDGTVTGTASTDGSDVVVAATCPNDIVSVPFNGESPVTGTVTSIEFHKESRKSGPGLSGLGTYTTTSTVTFTGALSGGVVTGTLKYSESSVFEGAQFPSQSSGTASFPVTLR